MRFTKKAKLALASDLTMANLFDRAAEVYGDQDMIVLEHPLEYGVISGDEFNYGDMASLSSHMAHALTRLGVQRGKRVIICPSNGVDIPLLAGSVMKMGGIAVPLNFMLRGKEIAYIARNCGARYLITDPEVFAANIRDKEAVPDIEEWIMTGPAERVPDDFHSLDDLMADTPGDFEPVKLDMDDVVGIFYTSGTTGFPKGAMMTSRGLLTGQKFAALALPVGPGDFGIHCLPLSHLFGYGICIMGLVAGMRAYMMRHFDPIKVMRAIERFRATVFVGVPVMYQSMCEAGMQSYDLSSMRMWASSADAMPQEYIDAAREIGSFLRLGPFSTKSMFAEAYGMVELSAIVSLKMALPGVKWPRGCVGIPLFPIRTRVVDESGAKLPNQDVGELLISGPGVMKGYWNNPEETDQVMDGKWFHTGDMAWKDRWGRIFFVDRKKDVIKCGGYSVFSVEVEQEILAHPDVQEAAVVGVPHPVKGQAPVAVICLEEGKELGEEEFLEWCRENIASYKVPRRVHIVPLEEMPYGTTLKILKRELRKRYIDDFEDGPQA
ncbi:MAG: class I adenylate-forming enzyme family protein [Actinomycetota bacterium]|nr:class I adenylate-forming enzyme family protein [Actinomycetota bacterium]